jgi:hypothetical protein
MKLFFSDVENKMFRGFRLVVSVTAALPINVQDGDAVYNFRGSVSTGHFLGQLFRTLNQVLHHPSSDEQDETRSDEIQQSDPPDRTSNSMSTEMIDEATYLESTYLRIYGKKDTTKHDNNLQKEVKKTKVSKSELVVDQKKTKFCDKDGVPSTSVRKEVITCLPRAQPTCRNSSQGKCYKKYSNCCIPRKSQGTPLCVLQAIVIKYNFVTTYLRGFVLNVHYAKTKKCF